MVRTKEKKPKKPFLSGYKTYDPAVEGFGNVSQWRAAWEAMNKDEAEAIMAGNDPLTVMGFKTLPSLMELNKRFRDLVMQHHPDHGGDRKMFQAVYAAWSLLIERCK